MRGVKGCRGEGGEGSFKGGLGRGGGGGFVHSEPFVHPPRGHACPASHDSQPSCVLHGSEVVGGDGAADSKV